MIDAPDWYDQAACAGRDTRMFYSEQDANHVADFQAAAQVRRAKQVCSNCPVRQACLIHAFVHLERFGIWGGLTARERKTERRKWLTAGRPAVWGR